MPRKTAPREIVDKGCNRQGNTYTQYSDGSYRYTNQDGGRYYNTGNGHAFYRPPKDKKAPAWHENTNKGYRNIQGSGEKFATVGTNDRGNRWVSYDEGGYRYTNRDSSGNVTGRYYQSPDGQGYSYSKK